MKINNNKTPSQNEIRINENSESEQIIKETGNKRLRDALIRVGAAFIAAIILLSITSFSFIDLIKGPKETESLQSEEIGAFVKYKIYVILGTYANGEYALIPMDGKIVTVHFTKRYLESVDTIATESQNYFNGLQMFDKYVIVQGTADTLDEDLSTQMYDWFGNNKEWMVDKRVITDTSDYADYLSDSLLTVDTVNSQNQNFVFVLTGIAALLLLYAVVELLLMSVGFYLAKTPKAIGKDANTEAMSCINNEVNSENIDSLESDNQKDSKDSEEK